LSALHDLNALAMVRQSDVPITVLIVNNHGGGIFDYLPVAKETVHYERYFATPHQLSFSSAAKMFDLPYDQPEDLNSFQASFRRALQTSASSIIELVTERDVNLSLRARIRNEILK
jgi:2-succinyl-5-enolpyruvyl-6-hydroxy-3-cyclohexene-1-carboxylate synthase